MTSPAESRPHPPDPPGLPGVPPGAPVREPELSATRPGRTTGQTPAAALVWVALVVVYLVWGSTYLGIRISVETLPPFLSAAMRFGAAAIVLAAALTARSGWRVLRVTRRELGAGALVGVLLLAGGNGIVVYAESGPPGRAVPSGIAALLIATVPLLLVVLRSATGDRPPATTLIGVAVGFAGLVVLVLPSAGGRPAPLLGALLVVGAAASWSVGSFLSGRLPLPANPFVASVYEMLAGALVLGLAAVARGEHRGLDLAAVSARSWLALLYLMVAGSLVAFTAYVWLLHNVPISLVATYAYVNPVVAVALGALLLAEPVTAQVLLGGAVIVVGVALVVSTERPGRR